MNKKTKLALGVIGVGAVAYYLYTKNKAANTKNYAANVGDRLGADGLVSRFKKAWKANKYLPQYGVEATSVRFDSTDYVNQSGAWDKFKKAVKPYLPQTYHPENASSAPAKKKKAFADDNFVGFADGGYVVKGDLYNNNMRYGMTGGNTFFTNQSEKLNY